MLVKMKKIIKSAAIAFVSAVILLAGGCGNNDVRVFKDKVIPDFEIVLNGYNEVLSAYDEAADALQAYADAPTEENKAEFLRCAEASDAAMEKYNGVRSSLGESEYTAMERLNLSVSDYNGVFDTYKSDLLSLPDWEAEKTLVKGKADKDKLNASVETHRILAQSQRIDLVYGTMHFVSDTEKEVNESMRKAMEKYPSVMSADTEWLTDGEKAIERANDEYDKLEERLYRLE